MSLLGNVIWLVCGGLFRPGSHRGRDWSVPHGDWHSVRLPGDQDRRRRADSVRLRAGGERGRQFAAVAGAQRRLAHLLRMGDYAASSDLGDALGADRRGNSLALQHIKLLPLALLPFGRDLVRTSGAAKTRAITDRRGITRVRSAGKEWQAVATQSYSAAISVSSNRTLCRRSTDSCCTMRPLASYHRSTFTSPVMW